MKAGNMSWAQLELTAALPWFGSLRSSPLILATLGSAPIPSGLASGDGVEGRGLIPLSD